MIERRLTLVLILVTFSLLLLGGYVHNTESSLACPDWPLCYGKVFPKMEGGVLIEHSHRLLAAFVGIITFIIAIMTRKKYLKTDKSLVNLTYLAFVLVLIQGILGGITVLYKLPTIVSTTHLGLSQIFYLTLIYLYHRFQMKEYKFVQSEKAKTTLKKNWNPAFKDYLFIGTAAIYLQMILGAFLRHSGVGAVCGVGYKNALKCLDTANWIQTWWPTQAGAQLHMSHRLFAYVTSFLVVVGCLKGIKFFIRYNLRREKWPLSQIYWGLLPILFIFIQVGVGIWTVGSGLNSIPTTLHLGFAALALGFMWKYYLNFKTIETEVFVRPQSTLMSDLFELTKPKLAFLSVMTALFGLIIAPGHINFFQGLLVNVLIAFIVAGACALNCYIERDIDALMERTKDRALPSGRLNPKVALVFAIALISSGVVLSAIFVNMIVAALGLIAAILYVYAYTPMKQKGYYAVFVGGIPGAIPPLMGWAAVTGSIDQMAMVLFAIMFIWQLPHFFAISIYCETDYKAASIKVLPSLKGVAVTKIQIFLYTLLLFATTIVPFYIMKVTTLYKVSSIVLGLFLTLVAILGFFTDNDIEKDKEWAKKYFWATLVYLPLLFFSLIFF